MRPVIPSANYPENAVFARCDRSCHWWIYSYSSGLINLAVVSCAQHCCLVAWHLSFHLLITSLLTKLRYIVFWVFFNLPPLPLLPQPSLLITPLIFDWQYHPDKQSADVPAGTVEECIQKFIEIDQAWKILGNEETKKEYDLQRHGRYLWGAPVHWQCFEAVCSHSWGAFSSIRTKLLLPPSLLPSIIVSNYALFLAVIIVYPLRS